MSLSFHSVNVDDLKIGDKYYFKIKGNILYKGELTSVKKDYGIISDLIFTNVECMNNKDTEPKFTPHRTRDPIKRKDVQDLIINGTMIDYYNFYSIPQKNIPLKLLFLQDNDNSNTRIRSSSIPGLSYRGGGKKHCKTNRKSRKNTKSRKNRK